MFSTCSELTPRAPTPNGRMARIMQPCLRAILLLSGSDRRYSAILEPISQNDYGTDTVIIDFYDNMTLLV